MTDQPPLLATRVVSISIISTAVFFWAVAWVMTGGGTRPLNEAPPAPAGTLFTAWAVLAVTAFAAALFLQRLAVHAGEAERTGDPTAVNMQVQARLFGAWALLEVPALAAGVLLLLWGQRLPVLLYAPILLVAATIAFPRAEWFR